MKPITKILPMKPITKYLAAGSLAAAFLFASKEGFNFTNLLNKDTASKQAATNDNNSMLPPAAAPLPKALPITLTTNTNQAAVAQVSNVAVAHGSTYDLKHAVVLPYKPVAFSRKIDVAKLISKIKTASVAIHVNKMAPSIDSAMVAKVAETPEAKTELVAAFSEPHKTGGSAYHATKLAKAENKAGANVKSPVDISSFSSLKKADNGAEAYSYSAVYDGTEELKEFAARSGNNTDYAIMVNLGLKSGKKRFFVMDLSTNTIIKCGIVAEGSGDLTSTFEKKYSNEMGSTATSLGIFKIGKRTPAKYAYRLQGLQESNSNAYKRAMLLQAADDVQNDEINFPTLKTNGSLSLSPSFFKEISPMLDASSKPVLLLVYDPTADSQASYSAVQKK